MRLLFSLLVALVGLAGCHSGGQQQAIPGTHLLVAPPSGFRVSPVFTGLEHPDGSRLLVMDLSPNSYLRDADGYTRERLEAGGATVKEFALTTVSGYPARYSYVVTPEGEYAYQVMFGDSTFAVLAVIEPAPGHLPDGEALKQTVLACTYDKHLKTDPLASAPFVLNTFGTQFRFVQATGNMYTYTRTDLDSTHVAPILTIVPLPADQGTTLLQLRQQMQESLVRSGMTDANFEHELTGHYDGCEVYETEIHCLLRGQPALSYELLLLGRGKALLVNGITPSTPAAAADTALTQLRRLARTIRVK